MRHPVYGTAQEAHDAKNNTITNFQLLALTIPNRTPVHSLHTACEGGNGIRGQNQKKLTKKNTYVNDMHCQGRI